jgi:hypothetical protein
MKRVTAGLCAMLVLGLISSSVSAQEEAEKTETEKAFDEYAKFLTRGVWKATVKRGSVVNDKWQPTGEVTERVQEYRLFAGGRFMQRIDFVDGEQRDGMVVVGVAPQTDKVTWWQFSPNNVLSGTSEKNDDGTWTTGGSMTNAAGQKVEWKRIRTLEGDEYRIETVQVKVDGEELAKAALDPPITWKLHKK